MEKVIVDSAMRVAFARAHNRAKGSWLKRAVGKRLRTNKGRIFRRGWTIKGRRRKQR